jgi:hypothetical protein
VNPFRAAIVIVETPVTPWSRFRASGLAVSVKLATLTVTSASWMSLPLIPCTSTMYGPGLTVGSTLIVSVEVWDEVMLVGLNVVVMPGRDKADRTTGLLNPLIGLTATVDVLDEPAAIVRMVGVAEIAKSGPVTVTGIVISWKRPPLLADTSTL